MKKAPPSETAPKIQKTPRGLRKLSIKKLVDSESKKLRNIFNNIKIITRERSKG